jgi:hypothetical protein
MRKIFILFLPILLLCGLCWLMVRSQDPALRPPALSKHDLDKSLGIKQLGRKFVLHRSADRQIRRLARQFIDKRKSEWKGSSSSSIPQIIHQFWLSDDPLPDDFARAARLIQQQHPGFKYALWRFKDVKNLLEELVGPDIKSYPSVILRDIAAAAVLWQTGGIAVDFEAECVHSLSPLLPLGDCIIGFEPPLSQTKRRRRLLLSPSVILARPSHPLITAYLAEMVRRAKASITKKSFDPQWITQDSLTVVAAKAPIEQDRPLLLSPRYFCPVCPAHINRLKRRLNCEDRRNSFLKALQTLHITASSPFSDLSRETIFVHMTGGREAKAFSSKIDKQYSIND